MRARWLVNTMGTARCDSDTPLIQEELHNGRKDLTEEVRHKLAGHFDGSISWYVTTAKLDLEARGMTERVPKKLHNSFVWLKREADGCAVRGCKS